MTDVVIKDKNYWNTTPLEQLDTDDWEALCDGCAKCCLHKLRDADDDEVYYTDVVCNLIDLNNCKCSDYNNRHVRVPDCVAFKAQDIVNMDYLPDTCAYKLRFLGEPLYDWHYLISGDRKTIFAENETILWFAVIDEGQDLEEHVIYFKP